MAVFTNRAILTYNGAETLSNTVTGEIIGALTVYKEPVPPVYSAGSSVTYALSLVNSSDAPLTGLTVTDDLGAYTDAGATLVPLTYSPGSAVLFTNGAPSEAPLPSLSDPLTFTDISVPANGNVLLIYGAEVNGYAPMAAGSSITNTVTVTGSGADASAQAVTAVLTEPILSVTKSVSPQTVMANGKLTYAFVIENSGNAAAGGDLVLSDEFSPLLSDISVTLDGAALDAGTDYTYDAATGAFSTVPGVITVPPASCSRAADGSLTVLPGRATLTVSGAV